jgi:uncharacterized membrane-anchored protein YhcB (DUF1043 family)
MWLVELMGLVVLVGAVLGVVWRFAEDWFEKRSDRQRQEFEAELNKEELPTLDEVKNPPIKQFTNLN